MVYAGTGVVFVITRHFVTVIMQIRDPKTTVLIFVSGMMVVSSAKTHG
jgi:TATA-box binding protein (TBP) (component of TFIID and TFIIIB)